MLDHILSNAIPSVMTVSWKSIWYPSLLYVIVIDMCDVFHSVANCWFRGNEFNSADGTSSSPFLNPDCDNSPDPDTTMSSDLWHEEGILIISFVFNLHIGRVSLPFPGKFVLYLMAQDRVAICDTMMFGECEQIRRIIDLNTVKGWRQCKSIGGPYLDWNRRQRMQRRVEDWLLNYEE